MTARDLRLAIQAKLADRRRLMGENSRLRGDLDRERAQTAFLKDAITNPLVEMAIENCADQIMREVVDHAARASEIVAQESFRPGIYEIGISIPSLHIRHALRQWDLRFYRGFTPERQTAERIQISTAERPY